MSLRYCSLIPISVFAEEWTTPSPDHDAIPSVFNTIYNKVDGKLTEYEYEGYVPLLHSLFRVCIALTHLQRSTATTVVVWKDDDGNRYLQSANVGDSTAFLVRGGKAISLGEDHKVYCIACHTPPTIAHAKPTLPSERERIKAMGITLEEGQSRCEGIQTCAHFRSCLRLNGLAVSRAFGNHFPKEMNCGMVVDPYVSPLYKLSSRDTHLIIASDGVRTAKPHTTQILLFSCSDK